MVTELSGSSSGGAPPRVAFGPGAPASLAEFVAGAGIEVLPYMQRHAAALYVDFVGARPSGSEVLSIDLGRSAVGGGARFDADLTTDDWRCAGCLIISSALRLRPPLLTADSAMVAAIRSIIGVAASPVPVILQGEIGAGKYNLARLCHLASRSHAPLLTINCARFEQVDHAALLKAVATAGRGPKEVEPPGAAMLYLDEIGELNDAAQIKLLELLQGADRLIWSGAQAAARPALRFIAATNRALETLVERGEFRRELYWRLKVFALEIPALRRRPADIILLARYFLRRANPRRVFSPAAFKLLGGYAFPGNVLELESLITRIAIAPLASGGGMIDAADIRQHLVLSAGVENPISGWKSSREDARREMILRTIAAAGGNRLEAARRLGITLRALQYHITKAGLSRRRTPRTSELDQAARSRPPLPTLRGV